MSNISFVETVTPSVFDWAEGVILEDIRNFVLWFIGICLISKLYDIWDKLNGC